MREAASLVISSRLLAEGAYVRAHDPVANEVARPLLRNADIYDDPMKMLEGADAAVLVTEWPEYAELDLVRVKDVMRTPLLVDGRNLFTPAQAAHAGLTYEGVGRPGAVVGTPRRRTEDTSTVGER
jgi:UDPglucose 6-dehydrogenase